MSLLANEKSKVVKFHFHNEKLTLSSSSPETGEVKEEMMIPYQGEDLEIGFNSSYLIDCLQVMNSDEIEFQFKNKESAGLIKESMDNMEDTLDHSHTYILMPMRI